MQGILLRQPSFKYLGQNRIQQPTMCMRRWAKSVQRNVVGDPVRPVRPHKILLDAQTIHGTIQSALESIGSQHQDHTNFSKKLMRYQN